ncbi:GFA family protein [Caballeronia ptereochthonis]|uniref:Glutathione-dependent formaldehyde-activating protein n=1 Tax=Caballeronia ptereochthonis TaxID=1777144 RepID=A0A158BA66_9BURK|nr:GFA family protein [Caballeronia ptereochthonis]SAK66686.1 glutathione-dependent formaldehyde-activating protein [Caballeronia ptereochthonis]
MNPTILKGACHCGTVTFEVDTPLEPAVRCNCSLCRRRGAVMSPPFPADKLRILSGENELAMYEFNTRVAKHFFCRRCGIYTFHQTRANPDQWRVNLGCIEGVDAYSLDAPVADGASSSVVTGA